jgi:TolB-like protein/class 3 adenylate cyclase/tetratricopeptide (TPR) repeat protein
MADLTDVTRRLVAVFAADVDGYSRLMGTDEVGTLRGLTERRAILDRLIGEHRGRIANTAGDSVLAEFGSAVDAVQCAVDAQAALAEANSNLTADGRIDFRIGVHIGDVMIRAGDLFGDGVNIAARLQTLAKPGGVCISGATHDQVRKLLPITFTDLGVQLVKNIEEPVRAFAATCHTRTECVAAKQVQPRHLSLVVLPFVNIGGEPDQEYFVDGVTESLTTDLSHIAGAFVIARNTAFTFKGKAVDVKKLGRELNVRYVLEGSAQRAGNRLRVNVQLIDAETGNHLWAERFDKPVADLFDMQDEIVSRLANTLNVQLIDAEARRAQGSTRPDAMDLYFQGRAFLNREVTSEYLRQARGLFERALLIDPSCIEALYGCAVVDLQVATNYFTDDPLAFFTAAETATNKVLSLAPNHAPAHHILGNIFIHTNRVAQGIAQAERALELDRNLSVAHATIGFAKFLIGRGEETEAHVHEALRLSPRDYRAYQYMFVAGCAKLWQEAPAEAVEWLRRSVEANRNYALARFQLAVALANVGELDEAQAAVKAGLALQPSFTIRRYRANVLSNHPAYLAGRERTYEGMRMAGVPEG